MKRLGLALAALACLAAAPSTDYRWSLPRGVAPPPVPADNPMTAAKVELGRRLFYEADLSIDGTVACATCHEQHRAFADGNATHPGVKGAKARRNVMGLANVGYFPSLTWGDPRLRSLEAQVPVPIEGQHPVEMGMAGQSQALAERLGADPCYRTLFKAAFPAEDGRIAMDAVAKALAAFERTLVSFDAPYDRYRRGDRAAIPEPARRGAALFFGGRLGCSRCHGGPDLTDGRFHGIGLYDLDGAGAYPADDHGLREITGKPGDEGRFRTPSLRNVALTGPYMHDGSLRSLAQAIRAHDPNAHPLRDRKLSRTRASDQEVVDLSAFLESLSDLRFTSDSAFALPKVGCAKAL